MVERPPAVPATDLLGFDVSIYTEPFDWRAMLQRAPFAFAFIECAHGVQVGKSFSSHMDDARNAGIRVGTYQRFVSEHSVEEHVEAFAAAIANAPLSWADVPPVLDVECDPSNAFRENILDPEAFRLAVHAWIEQITVLTRRVPMIYTSRRGWSQLLGDAPDFSQSPLWVAQYENLDAPPVLPSPWSAYAFWQYQENINFGPGLPMIDLDVFAGGNAQLDVLVEATQLP